MPDHPAPWRPGLPSEPGVVDVYGVWMVGASGYEVVVYPNRSVVWDAKGPELGRIVLAVPLQPPKVQGFVGLLRFAWRPIYVPATFPPDA